MVFVVISVEEGGSRKSAFEVSSLNDVDGYNVGEVALSNVTDYSHITIKFGIPSGSFGVAIGGGQVGCLGKAVGAPAQSSLKAD